MKKENRIKLFLVDDDAIFLKLLEIEFLQNADFDIVTFQNGEQCIENLARILM
jgi:two-component system, OmpR family, response regulator